MEIYDEEGEFGEEGEEGDPLEEGDEEVRSLGAGCCCLSFLWLLLTDPHNALPNPNTHIHNGRQDGSPIFVQETDPDFADRPVPPQTKQEASGHYRS